MRVSCESCGAKYNLPDDKVRGRKAKVRCKRCSASIVVDGTSVVPGGEHDGEELSSANEEAGFDEEEATTVMQSPLSAMRNERPEPPALSGDWTVNVTDEDQRQMSVDQVRAAWLVGEVSRETLVWREGMEDWLPVGEVAELADALHSGAPAAPAQEEAPVPSPAPAAVAPAAVAPAAVAPAAVTPAAVRPAATDLFGSGPASSPAPSSRRNPAQAVTAPRGLAGGARAARPATFDLFGPPRSLERDSQPAKADSRPPARTHEPVASSENSVVFSLEALTASSATKTKTAEVRASEDLLTMGGVGLGESPFSAPLIDPTKPPAPEFPLMSPGTVGGTVAAPVQEKKVPVWVWGLAGVVILGAGFFGGRVFMAPEPSAERTGTEAAASGTATEPERKADTAGAEDSKADSDKADTSDSKTDSDKAEDGKTDGKADSDKAEGTKTDDGDKGETQSGSKSPPKGGSAPAPKSDPPKAATGGGAKFNVGAAKAALASAAAAAQGCKSAGGPTGAGKVQVTFAPSGRVTSAKVVSGPFGGTSVGGCVARKFRAASVPAFDGSPTTVSKSFSVN